MKLEKKINLKVNTSSSEFIKYLIKNSKKLIINKNFNSDWSSFLEKKKVKFYIPGNEQKIYLKKTNPYIFFDQLSNILNKNSNIFISTGSTVTWAYQSFKIKSGQRFVSANGHSPMGYALPASIVHILQNQKKYYLYRGRW